MDIYHHGIDYKAEREDRIIKLDIPEREWDVATSLKNPDLYAVESIHLRFKPEEHR
ncbi:hypothetical protein [Coxiella-like endosymbiont]|uniref:hypothetical protein n=1 Tax=Coxiella-like endosymbiont TaxID=1592897 RepID=UPI00272B140D|nr:hypothetical protein [Coxiella-like endosymbiont]